MKQNYSWLVWKVNSESFCKFKFQSVFDDIEQIGRKNENVDWNTGKISQWTKGFKAFK